MFWVVSPVKANAVAWYGLYDGIVTVRIREHTITLATNAVVEADPGASDRLSSARSVDCYAEHIAKG